MISQHYLEGDLSEGAILLPNTLLGPDPQQTRPYLKALSLAFFNRHLMGQTAMNEVLSQSYLDSLGIDLFRSTIVKDLN